MENIAMIDLDIAKSVFQVHSVDASGDVMVRRRLSRARDSVLREAAALSCWYRSVQHIASLGPRVDRTGTRWSTDASAIGEALCEGRQARRCRCRSYLRGRRATNDAVRRGEDAGAAERDDASSRPADAQPPTHPAVERDAGAYVGVRDGAPGETRTPDLRFRKPLLCPAELPGPGLDAYAAGGLASMPKDLTIR